MPIKHLVLAGGGPLGFKFLGAIEYLNREKYWNRDDIESIYATSIGGVIAAFICLNHDWETLNKYVIERPWDSAFKLNAKQLFDVYYSKGLYGDNLIETILKPLLRSKNLETNISMKEFYEFSHIDLHLFTFDMNAFEILEISYMSHPDMLLIRAITMSCALPGLFMPVFMDDV
jgi:predicted acylesterase/phospholipase RssA